ncbi:MAG: CHAT domain-containing protein [Oscillatoriales cyanobacterium]|nr:MAG: CHAT domain-containing protein [Oscillatoriales cyanobacterium]
MSLKSSFSVIDFLQLLLQAVRESDATPEVLYPILKKNLDKLENILPDILKEWVKERLTELEPEERHKFAKDIGNLCIVIRSFPCSYQSNNIEIALAGYEIITTVFTREYSPENWAGGQHNLGIAYCTRILGDKAQNLEQGIAYFKNALQVCTRKNFPSDWAEIQNSMGNAYLSRIVGKKEENIERAIRCHKRALGIHNQNAFPQKWASIQHSLGNAYSERILSERDNNLERSIQHYKNALQVYTRATYPKHWAGIQNNLGGVYQERLLEEKAENLKKAISYHKKALQVYTYRSDPEEWAMTQSNLGVTYGKRILGNTIESLIKQVECYKNALRVYTKDSFPLDHAQTLYNLGIAYKNSQKFEAAYTTFVAAIETVEFLRSLIVLKDYNTLTTAINTLEFNPFNNLSEEEAGQEVKRKFAEEWNLLYQATVEVCLELGYPDRAIEYVERSKTRNLIECLAQKDTSSNFEFIRFPQILESLPNNHTSIIQWYITPETLIVFIINKQIQHPIIWQPPSAERKAVLQALIDWTNRYIDDYEGDGEDGKRWKKLLDNSLQCLASILHVDEILSLLPKHCNQLILIPHWFLHLLPIHALPLDKRKNQCLLDKFSRGVRYAPSCQLLHMTKNYPRHQANQATPDTLLPRLLAMQNPTEDLPYADLEVQGICRSFHKTQVLANSKATKAAFYQELSSHNLAYSNYIHFSGHAFFNSYFTLKSSALFFAGCYVPADLEESDSGFYITEEDSRTKIDLNKCLTLIDIYTLTLPQCCLITLSACETGMTDFYNTSDEYVSIGGAFLYAGTPNVVSSLWVVNDLSNVFLMIKFYQNLQAVTSVAVALNQAQLWLRDITKAELKAWITANSLPLDPTMRQNLSKRLHKLQDDQKPFQDPFHWAAFCAIGQ